LSHDPAAKNVAIGVAVGGHGDDLEHQLLIGGQSYFFWRIHDGALGEYFRILGFCLKKPRLSIFSPSIL
jgi:hypothetical protein